MTTYLELLSSNLVCNPALGAIFDVKSPPLPPVGCVPEGGGLFWGVGVGSDHIFRAIELKLGMQT